ncbi:MAG: serine hydrolase [Planctomycetota bacterium]
MPGAADRPRLAPGHASLRDPVPAWDFDALAGAGALRSTAEDLLRFAEAHFGQAPGGLGAAIEESCRPRAPVGVGQGEVGLGWHRAPLPDRRVLLWHDGRTGGYASFLGVVREARAAVAALSNVSTPVNDVARRILDELLRPR